MPTKDEKTESYWRGESRVVALAGGAATGGVEYQIPGATQIEIGSLAFKLVASGAPANRQVLVRLQDATGADLYAIAAPGQQTAGQTVIYGFAPLVPVFGSAGLGFMGGPLPGGKLPANLSVVVTVTAAAAGDVLSLARMIVRQWEVTHR